MNAHDARQRKQVKQLCSTVSYVKSVRLAIRENLPEEEEGTG